MLRKLLFAAASATALFTGVAMADVASAPAADPLAYQIVRNSPSAQPSLYDGAGPARVQPIQYAQPSAYQSGDDGMGGSWQSRQYGRAYAGVIVGGQAELDAIGTTETGPILSSVDEDDFEIGWQAGYAIGIENFPARNWRLEVEGFYADTETDDGIDFIEEVEDEIDDEDLDQISAAAADVTLYGGLFNVLYDIDYSPAAGWRPFVGAGIGYGRLEAEYQGIEATDEVFLWQAMAGAGYDFGNGRSLEFSYRYLNAGSADFDADDGVDFNVNGDVEVDEHALLAAYRYRWF